MGAFAAAGLYAGLAFRDAQASQSCTAAGRRHHVQRPCRPPAPFVLFRNTAPGQGFGLAATVPLSGPGGQRALERSKLRSRLRHARSDLVPADQAGTGHHLPGHRVQQHLAGDAQLAAARHPEQGQDQRRRIPNWAPPSSCRAIPTPPPGSPPKQSSGTRQAQSSGSLEGFALLAGRAPGSRPPTGTSGASRSLPESPTSFFYATASSQGHIWLAQGNIAGRTLTVVRSGIECPVRFPGRHPHRLQKERQRHPDRPPQCRRRGPRQRHGNRPGGETRALMIRLSGWTTPPCCTPFPGTAPKWTATSGPSQRTRPRSPSFSSSTGFPPRWSGSAADGGRPQDSAPTLKRRREVNRSARPAGPGPRRG